MYVVAYISPFTWVLTIFDDCAQRLMILRIHEKGLSP
jgi:hypothetical protein